MNEDLLGYLMDALDERAKRQVESYLAQHPETQEKLRRLRQALAPLAADKDAPELPPQLVERTLARVAEQICSSANDTASLPHAPPVSPTTIAGGRSWWRRADVLVAACLLVTVAGVGLIVLGRMRGPSSSATIAECQNNLHQFYVALKQYQVQHRQFPDVAKEAPRDVAGMVVPILKEAGTLPDTVSIRCPGMGSPLSCQRTVSDLSKLSVSEFDQLSPCLSMCYAYSLGYRDPVGVYHGPGDNPQGTSQTPIMADRSPAEGVFKNSSNHSAAGQNVLFADGRVVFLTERTFGTDDIFLNRAGLVAAGLDAADIVLGYSAARP